MSRSAMPLTGIRAVPRAAKISEFRADAARMDEQLAAAAERRARDRSAREKADVERAVRESLKSEQEASERRLAEKLAEVEKRAAAAEEKASDAKAARLYRNILLVDREPEYDYFRPAHRVTSIEDLFGSPTLVPSYLRVRAPVRNVSRERMLRLIEIVAKLREFMERTIKTLSGERPHCPSFSYDELMARPSELYDATLRSFEKFFKKWAHLSKKEFTKKKRTIWESSEEERDELQRGFRKICRLQASIREHWTSGLSALESAAVPEIESRMKDFTELLTSIKFRKMLIDDD